MINGKFILIWGNNGIRIGVIVGYTDIPIYLGDFDPFPVPGIVRILGCSTALLPHLWSLCHTVYCHASKSLLQRCLPCHCLPRFQVLSMASWEICDLNGGFFVRWDDHPTQWGIGQQDRIDHPPAGDFVGPPSSHNITHRSHGAAIWCAMDPINIPSHVSIYTIYIWILWVR